MNRIFAKELIGKVLVNNDNYTVGTVSDIVVDTETGEVRFVLIDYSPDVKKGEKIDSKGRGVISVDKLEISGNKIKVS